MHDGLSSDDVDNKGDRKLGDEWIDWDGDLGSYEWRIEESALTFMIFAAVSILFLSGIALFIQYMIDPRLQQINPILSIVIKYVVDGGIVFLSIWFLILVIAIISGRSVPLPLGKMSSSVNALVPIATWLGLKFGISKDRMAHSMVRVSNAITRTFGRKVNGERLLVVLPRCLDKSTRTEIAQLGEKYQCQVFIAGGGEMARKIVKDRKPTAIIGVACERDLVSGIRDVAPRIPVIGIPNIRPEGPCKNSTANMESIEEAIRFFVGKRNKPYEKIGEDSR